MSAVSVAGRLQLGECVAKQFLQNSCQKQNTMEPQNTDDRELRTIKKRLCYISSTACAFSLVCAAATLVLALSHRTGFCSEEREIAAPHRNPGDMVNRTPSHSRTAVMAQLHLAIRQDKDSTTLLWHEDGILNGIKYKNGSLTVATEGLYYVYCHLQFTIKQCMKEEAELVTKLSVNGLEKHQVMHTMCRQENCTSKIYRDQHLNLQLELKTSDNVSIQSTHVDFLNKEQLAQSNLFGIFML